LDISSRIPKLDELVPVYAVIVLMIYGWTILKFNYSLSGWIYFLNLGEIMGIFAYSMVINLFESMFVLLGVIAAGVVLPRKWFGEAFIARGASLSILVLMLMMYIASQFSGKQYYPADIIRWSPAILVLIGLVVYLLGRVQFIRNAIEFFADRAIIFLYISIPVSFLSLVIVLIRNVF
jgi:hypothetical protein